MSTYTLENGKYYVIKDPVSGEVITFGEISENQVLSTVHKVYFIDKDTYDLYKSESDKKMKSMYGSKA